MTKLEIRVLADVFIFILILVLPWYISAVILILSTIYFPTYLEVLFWAFILDTQYSEKHTALVTSLLFLLAVLLVRTRIRA